MAHELARREYLVTFTTGNARGTDLLCESPTGVQFSLEVKSMRQKSYYLCQRHHREPKQTKYFVFVYLPEAHDTPPEYYVLNNEQFRQACDEQERLTKEAEVRRGKPYKDFPFGVNYTTVSEYKDKWENLPK